MAKRTNKKYPKKFIDNILNLYHQGKKINELSKEFSVSYSLLNYWIKRDQITQIGSKNESEPIQEENRSYLDQYNLQYRAMEWQQMQERNKKLLEQNNALKKVIAILASN